MLGIFRMVRDTRKQSLHQAHLTQTEPQQTLCRQELQTPAFTCQATAYFCPQWVQKDCAESEFTSSVPPIWKEEKKKACWQELSNTFLIAGHRGKFMSCSPWQHLGSVTFSCLHSFLFSLSYSTTPGFLAWVPHAVLPMTAGICHEPLCHQVSAGHWFPSWQPVATALLNS